MILVKLRLLGLGVGIATLLTLTACGAAPAEGTDEAAVGGKDRTATDAARKSEPAPPADYVRTRCGECSCRVFSGKTGYCSRPSCRHHWKKHR